MVSGYGNGRSVEVKEMVKEVVKVAKPTLTSNHRLRRLFVVLDEFQYVEWYIVVASPRHIRERVVDDDRHDVNVFFEDR